MSSLRPLSLLSPEWIEGTMSKSRLADPRTEQSGICGVVDHRGGPIEWVCINPVHADVYRSRRGKTIYSSNPRVDQHYFVNRYPNRKVTEE